MSSKFTAWQATVRSTFLCVKKDEVVRRTAQQQTQEKLSPNGTLHCAYHYRLWFQFCKHTLHRQGGRYNSSRASLHRASLRRASLRRVSPSNLAVECCDKLRVFMHRIRRVRTFFAGNWLFVNSCYEWAFELPKGWLPASLFSLALCQICFKFISIISLHTVDVVANEKAGSANCSASVRCLFAISMAGWALAGALSMQRKTQKPLRTRNGY